MKKTGRFLSLLMILMLALTFTACGGGSAEPEETEEGQNPIMNYVGNYACGRANIYISADDSKNACSAVITWSSSVAEYSGWMMTGTFDSEALEFEYHDCVKTDYVFNEDGEEEKAEEVYTGGHGFIKFKDGDPITLTWQDDQEHIADDSVFEFVGAVPSNGEEGTAGMANPWHTADSLKAAAEGAGVDGFDFAEDAAVSLGDIQVDEYRYMDGIAEIKAFAGAVDLTIRKGRADAAPKKGDISGDYGTYAHEWTQNIKGLEVKCFGNREGEATKTIWTVDDNCYAILAYGAGGDDDFGLNADDLNSLINGMQ